MTFRETLARHLRAIQERDLQAFRETLPADSLILIMSNGRLVQSVAEVVEMHRGWFEQTTWSLAATPVSIRETPDLGIAVLHLDYRDRTPDGRDLHETSYLTRVLARQDAGWVLVQDQNTPIREPAS